MPDEDNQIDSFLRQPATVNLMLMLVLAFVVFAVLLMVLGRAD